MYWFGPDSHCLTHDGLLRATPLEVSYHQSPDEKKTHIAAAKTKDTKAIYSYVHLVVVTHQTGPFTELAKTVMCRAL